MPRLSRHSGFDITDEPDDCYDATGQFPHLVTTNPVTADGTEPRRRRTIAYVALTLAATSAGAVVLAPRSSTGDEPATTSKPAHQPRPAPRARVVDAVRPEPTRVVRAPRPRKAKQKPVDPTGTPAATTQAVREAPLRPATPPPSEPAGGEFILGAR